MALCYRDLDEVKTKLAELASPQSRAGIPLNNRSVQRQYIGLAFRFRQSIAVLHEMGRRPRIPKGKVRKGWLFLVENYFWLMNHFLWALLEYEDDPIVKKGLLNIRKKMHYYEWVQNEICQCLALSQHFSARELQALFQETPSDDSWLAKRGLYYLLLRHARNPQFFRSIIARATKEGDPALLREILFMGTLWQERGIAREDLLEAFGLK